MLKGWKERRAEKASRRREERRAKNLEFEDFLGLLKALNIFKQSTLQRLIRALPFLPDDSIPEAAFVDEELLRGYKTAVASMTAQERRDPRVLWNAARCAGKEVWAAGCDERRLHRISRGAGLSPEVVMDLVWRYREMQGYFEQVEAFVEAQQG